MRFIVNLNNLLLSRHIINLLLEISIVKLNKLNLIRVIFTIELSAVLRVMLKHHLCFRMIGSIDPVLADILI